MKKCTRCEGTGFLDLCQIPENELVELKKSVNFQQAVLEWMEGKREEYVEYDVQICDCCGSGEFWYGVPGEHADF